MYPGRRFADHWGKSGVLLAFREASKPAQDGQVDPLDRLKGHGVTVVIKIRYSFWFLSVVSGDWGGPVALGQFAGGTDFVVDL